MISSMTRQRFAWLATCALFVACASTSTSSSRKRHRKHDTELAHQKKKKRKKKKKKRHVEVAEKRADEDEVRIIDDEDEDEARREDERREKKRREEKKRRQREEAKEAARRAEKKRKREEEEEEEEARREQRRRQKEKEEEARREQRRRQKEKEEDARREQRRRQKEEEEARLAEQKRKAKEEEEEEAGADDEDERPAKRERGRPVEVAEAEPAVIDMSERDTSDVIEMDEDEPPIRRVAAIPVPGVDDEDEDDEDELPDDLPPGAMPLAINSRPLIRPKDKLAVHAGLRVDVLTLPDPATGMDASTTTDSLVLGASYGLGDKLEVGADYAPSFSPGSAKGPFTLHGAYLAIHDDKLDLAVAAGLAVDFDTFTDPTTMATSTRSFASLQLGAWARYRLKPKVSLFSGVPAVPATTASVSKLSFALPPLPYQLAIGLNSGGTIALDLPVGVGYQAKRNIYVLAMLDLAHVRIANTQNAFLFKDFIPIALGGFYSLAKIDIGAMFSDDLKQGTDYLRFDIVARYSLK